MDWKLEVVLLPASDLDRARDFYRDQLGFNLDVDHRQGDFRVVQLTPPGSACSITFVSTTPPGTPPVTGLHLVVSDIDAARAHLVQHGVEARGPFHFAGGAEQPGPHPDHADYGSFLSFQDPDGNGWLVQEVPSRAV